MDLLERQREHWKKIHTTQMDICQLCEWINTIPGDENLTCGCQKKIIAIIDRNPPRFDDWWPWTWEVHNEVNLSINKPSIPWQEACTLWGWDPF